jgi:predicted ATPase
MIQHVRVNNFKTLNRVSLDLGLRNVIVGPNMSGKTNFLSLFKFLRLMVLPAPGVHGLLNALSSLGGFLALAWRGSSSNLISIELEGTLPSTADSDEPDQWTYRLEILSDGRGAVLVKTRLWTLTTEAIATR